MDIFVLIRNIFLFLPNYFYQLTYRRKRIPSSSKSERSTYPENGPTNPSNKLTTQKLSSSEIKSEAPISDVSTFPILLSSPVIKGFGRGSKILGIPTANMSMDLVGKEVNALQPGIYFGWSRLKGAIYKTAVSIGWNPCFDNKEKTVEPHLIHQFSEDFYGEQLDVLITGYIRPEQKFDSIDALVDAINDDIRKSCVELDKPEQTQYKSEKFWVS